MLSFVGKNGVIFEAVKFISSGNPNLKNICIYGDNIENLKKLGGAIIEYYKDISYFNRINKKYNTEKIIEEIQLKDKNFVEIYLSHDIEEEINLNNTNNDTIYFIYVHDYAPVDKIKFENKKI